MTALERLAADRQHDAFRIPRGHEGVDERVDEHFLACRAGSANRIGINVVHVEREYAVRERGGNDLRALRECPGLDERINKRLVRVVCNVCADRSKRLALLVRHIDHSGFTARRIRILRLYRRRFLLGVIRFFRLGRRDRLGLRVILRRSADLVFLEHEAIDAAADDHHQNDHDRHNDFCVFLHMNASLCNAARFLSCIYIIPQRRGKRQHMTFILPPLMVFCIHRKRHQSLKMNAGIGGSFLRFAQSQTSTLYLRSSSVFRCASSASRSP